MCHAARGSSSDPIPCAPCRSEGAHAPNRSRYVFSLFGRRDRPPTFREQLSARGQDRHCGNGLPETCPTFRKRWARCSTRACAAAPPASAARPVEDRLRAGVHCGRTNRRLLPLVHVLQTGFVKSGFFTLCSFRHRAQVTSIWVGGSMGGGPRLLGRRTVADGLRRASPIRSRSPQPLGHRQRGELAIRQHPAEARRVESELG